MKIHNVKLLCPNFLNVKEKPFDKSKDNYFYSHIKNVASFVNVVESNSTYELSDTLKAFIKSELEAQNTINSNYIVSPVETKIDSDGVITKYLILFIIFARV